MEYRTFNTIGVITLFWWGSPYSDANKITKVGGRTRNLAFLHPFETLFTPIYDFCRLIPSFFLNRASRSWTRRANTVLSFWGGRGRQPKRKTRVSCSSKLTTSSLNTTTQERLLWPRYTGSAVDPTTHWTPLSVLESLNGKWLHRLKRSLFLQISSHVKAINSIYQVTDFKGIRNISFMVKRIRVGWISSSVVLFGLHWRPCFLCPSCYCWSRADGFPFR